jgi:carboxypeptidase T
VEAPVHKVLLAILLVSTTVVPLAADEPPCDRLVVKVWFTDRVQVQEIAAWTEPWEVHPEKGWMLVDIAFDELDRLKRSGVVLEVDHKRTDEICTPPQRLPGQRAGIPGYPCYRTVEETFATAAQLAANHPDLAEWIDVGDSWEKTTPGGAPGDDMMVLKLTNRNHAGTPAGALDAKPRLFVTSSIHAREYTPAELMTRFAETLIEGYGVDADLTWLLDEHEIHLMLHANPDGRKQAETGLSWRKNTNENYCGATSTSRGADLNRNFAFQWGCCGGSSGDACSSTFRGASAASEPETQSVQNYIRSIFPDQRDDALDAAAPDDATGIYMDLHSYAEIIIWPWGFTGPDPGNLDQLTTLGRKLAYFNGYDPSHSIWYDVDGDTIDFAYGDAGVASFVFELGTSFFQDCGTFLDEILPDNLESLIYAAKVARTPYITPAGPEIVDLTVTTGSFTPPDSTATLTATADDTRFNNSAGAEPTQTIAAARCSVDAPPWQTPTPTFQAMSAADGGFDASAEAITIDLDTTGWTDGRHTVFCQAQDAAGAWGPVSAAFLWIMDPATAPTVAGRVTLAVGGAPVSATISIGGLVTVQSNPGDGSYSALIPAGTYDVTVTPDDPDLIPRTITDVVASAGATTTVDVAIQAYTQMLAHDGEGGAEGWTADEPWELTEEMAASPTHSWSDSPGVDYGDDADTSLTSPVLNLSDAEAVRIEFSHRWDFESGYDYGRLEVSADGGATWIEIRAWDGADPGSWTTETIEAPALAGAAQARVRFRVDTDVSLTRDGWHVDDIRILTGGTPPLFADGFESGDMDRWEYGTDAP